ncbi:MAG: hypothetical protein Q7S45_02890 [Candidatus Curtissbacteria bacterium]|nr:hypothetical protein [Candidatus Curtissbacteria bacterium]
MQKRGIILPLILIAILAIAGLIALGISIGKKSSGPTATNPVVTVQASPVPSPSPDETANWKTYTNNLVKFSLKLPTDIEVVGIGIGPPAAIDASEVIICRGCNNSVDPAKTPLIYIRTTELKYTIFKDMAFSGIVKQNYDANIANKNSTKSVIKPLQQITFAGEPAFTYTLDSSGYSGKYDGFTTYSGINKIIEVQRNGIFYVFIYVQDSTFDQILSTFRFTQ